MTLVDRFIEVNSWTASRKTALLSGFGLVAQIGASTIAHFAYASTAKMNMPLVDQLMGVFVLVIGVNFAISLLASRGGKEARWTAYLYILCYGTCLLAAIHGLGTWSSPMLAIFPLVVILCVLYYDDIRVGWFAFLYGLLSITAVGLLEVSGDLPYAPVLVDRTVDAQRSAGWIVGLISTVMGIFVFCFAFSVLVVMARRRQSRLLEDAHALLSEQTRQLERNNNLLRRYVPAQVVDAIANSKTETVAGHERRKLTMFFSDLVGFTEISERMEPEDLSRILNEYFTEMTAIADRHNGTIDELMGDAILILFGAPQATNDADHALRAVRMAVQMQAAVEQLNAKWGADGIDEIFRVRMGINTGVATIGNFGSSGRMKYAALGKHVNLAARLQAMCEPGKVLISHSTRLLVHDQIPCQLKGETTLKGIQRPVMTYEVL